jgi:hypothetical protein
VNRLTFPQRAADRVVRPHAAVGRTPTAGHTRGVDAPDTVVDAVALLKAEGYEVEFRLEDGHLRCDDEERACPCSDAVVERLYRFEGPSDPGDEMVVFALRDPVSGRRGVLASGFGPAADPEAMDHLVGLTSRFGAR